MKQQSDTKLRIAQAFQELTIKKSINNISITDIMKETKFRRQTFYDYFDDKYDLVTWIFSHGFSESVKSILAWENWSDILLHLLVYLERNKTYYKKIFLSVKLDSFKEYFIYSIKKIVQQLTNDYFKEQFLSADKKQLVQTATDFYSYGLSESLYHWVLENCEPKSQKYQSMLVQLVEHQTNIKGSDE
ncbi:MAG: dihydroxyacetone kinase transcriptional activator DhaS [Atopostipes sp.]|nr:dihydroxyacetone kinase transcriptional activator DhaS [Atopostipes sp.]